MITTQLASVWHLPFERFNLALKKLKRRIVLTKIKRTIRFNYLAKTLKSKETEHPCGLLLPTNLTYQILTKYLLCKSKAALLISH